MPLSTVLCPLLQQTTFQPAAAVLKHAVFHRWTTSIPKWEGSSLDLENPQKMQKSLTFECELTQADWHDLQPFQRRVGAVGCHTRVTLRVHIPPTPEKGRGQKGERTQRPPVPCGSVRRQTMCDHTVSCACNYPASVYSSFSLSFQWTFSEAVSLSWVTQQTSSGICLIPLKSWLRQLPTRDVGRFYASSTRWILIGTSPKGWLWELYGLGS